MLLFSSSFVAVEEEEGLAEVEVGASVHIGVDDMEKGMGKGSNMQEVDNVAHILVEEVPFGAAWAVLG